MWVGSDRGDQGKVLPVGHRRRLAVYEGCVFFTNSPFRDAPASRVSMAEAVAGCF